MMCFHWPHVLILNPITLAIVNLLRLLIWITDTDDVWELFQLVGPLPHLYGVFPKWGYKIMMENPIKKL